ncbi:MAG: NAD(P)/FAD-dependent oxidoreductase [Candidatus Bathyarchaeia archaeon]
MGYDVVIVGAGPAGIFAALELVRNGVEDVLMLDMGPEIDGRTCPASRGVGCVGCDPCYLLSGWGGAGAFSDGKLTLSTEVGGWLNEYIGGDYLSQLIDYVDGIYLRFGAPQRLYGTDVDRVDEIRRKALSVGLKLIPEKIRHLGTDKCPEILSSMERELRRHIDIRLKTRARDVLVKEGSARGVVLEDGEVVESSYVILAPGRVGAEWLKSLAQTLKLKTVNNPVDLGVRVEVAASVMEELVEVLYEPKFIYFSKAFDDKVRVFCVNPGGEVITESYNGVLTVNGQSYAEKRTDNTNFAILVSTSFTEPFKEPIAYGKYIARLANLLGGGIIVQRLGDLEVGRRSTEERIRRNVVTPTLATATPGDLSFVLPYRYLSDVREMLQAMDKVAPGLYAKQTLLYGVEVKFYSSRLELNENLETRIRNLFAAGDGAGITRGLIQSSVSGVIAAREIAQRMRRRAAEEIPQTVEKP